MGDPINRQVRQAARALASEGMVNGPYGPQYAAGMTQAQFGELMNGVLTDADFTIANHMLREAQTYFPGTAREINAQALVDALQQQLAAQYNPQPHYPQPRPYYPQPQPQPYYDPGPPVHHEHRRHGHRGHPHQTWGYDPGPTWKHMSGEQRAQAIAGGLATFFNGMQQLQQQQYQSQW